MGTLSDFNSVVAEFMNDFGTEATLIVPSLAGAYNSDTSSFTPTTDKRYKVRVIVVDFNKPKDGLSTQTNSLIQAGDKEVYIQPISNGAPIPTIQPNKDLLKIGTDTWSIVTQKDINPTLSSSVLVQLYIRK